MRDTGQYPRLTDHQAAVIRAFAEDHGRRWKATLRDLWMRAAAEPTLHNLRNTHGPSWLAGYRLPN